jgi:DNA primase
LGTALTPEQVKLLTRFARRVVVNYDGDQAGVQAAKKAIEILLTEDLEVKVLVLPDNADPDEFIRNFGANEYQQRRGEAQPHIQFVIDQAVRDRKLTNPAQKEAAIEEVLPFIRAVRSRIQKREYFDIAMDSLRVTDPSLRREFWQTLRSSEAERPVARRAASGHSEATPAEQRLLGVLFADEGLRRQVLPLLQAEDYEDLPTASIFRALRELEQERKSIDFDSLSEKTEGDTLAARLLPMLLMSDSLHASNENYTAEECVQTFRLMKINHRIDEIRAELAAAEREEDDERVSNLSNEQVELARRRGTLLPRGEAMQTSN